MSRVAATALPYPISSDSVRALALDIQTFGSEHDVPRRLTMNRISRRGFLAASAATLASIHMPRFATAATSPVTLTATRRTLDVNGRAATVFGLAGPSGQGLVLDPGQRFRVDLTRSEERRVGKVCE